MSENPPPFDPPAFEDTDWMARPFGPIESTVVDGVHEFINGVKFYVTLEYDLDLKLIRKTLTRAEPY
jgi:hypothetical protein